MQGTEGLGQLSHVLEPVLPIFGCDRVWLAYPVIPRLCTQLAPRSVFNGDVPAADP